MNPKFARRKPHEYNYEWKTMCNMMGRPYNYPFKILELSKYNIYLDSHFRSVWELKRFDLIESLYVNKKKGA